MDSITFTGRDAVLLSKAIKPAICKEKKTVTKHNLLHVFITGDGAGSIKFAATDGYRMHILTVTDSTPWGNPVMVNGEELVKALASLGRDAKNEPVTISSGDTVKVSALGSTVKISTYDGYFPQFAPLFEQVGTVELPARFNGDYLADMMTAAQLIGGDSGVNVLNMNPRKPALVQAVGAVFTFDGLLMPQRCG